MLIKMGIFLRYLINCRHIFLAFATLCFISGLHAKDFLEEIELWESREDQKKVNIAIVLSDITSNKDLEFTRGFVYGLENLPFIYDSNVTLKVINGEIPEDSLYNELSLFEPTAIISTHDKSRPEAIGIYADDNQTVVINAFDAKGEDYKKNPYEFQFLIPSEYYNKMTGKYISEFFEGSDLIIVGEPDKSDAILYTFLPSFPRHAKVQKIEDMTDMNLNPNRNYLFYVTSTNINEVRDQLKAIQTIMDGNLGVTVNILGRSNWIAMSELNPQFTQLEVFIPTKCYFEPGEFDSKRFIEGYNEKYGHNPVKSFPVYSVAGFDIANYFMPVLIDNQIDVEKYKWPFVEALQSDINFIKEDETGGFCNVSCFLVKMSEVVPSQKYLIK